MIVEFNCVVCGAHSRKSRSPANTLTTPKYCSQKCHGEHRKGLKSGERANRVQFICEQCGKESRAYRSPSQLLKKQPRFCSLKCIGLAHTGERNMAYSGGRFIGANGYAYVLAYDHPNKDCRGYVLEHRIVAEQVIGRFLTEEEVVHHKDRNKSNNDPSNLQVMASQSEHLKLHRSENGK